MIKVFWIFWRFAVTSCSPHCGLSLFLQDELDSGAEAEQTCASSPPPPAVPPPAPLQDPIRVQSLLRGFLLLMKQLQVFKDSWARRRLGAEVCRTPSLYQQLVKLYRYCGRFS